MFNPEKNFSPEKPQTAEQSSSESGLEREINQADRERLREHLEELKKNQEWEKFFHLAANMRIIFGREFGEEGICREEDCQEGLEARKKSLQERKEKSQWSLLMNEAAKLKVLFPERAEEFAGEEVWPQIREEITRQLEEKNPQWPKILNDLRHAKILFPEKFGEIGIDQERIQQELEKQIQEMAKTGAWERFLHCQATRRILFPEKSRDLELEAEQKKQIKEKIRHLRDGASFYKREDLFSETAADAKIASGQAETLEETMEKV